MLLSFDQSNLVMQKRGGGTRHSAVTRLVNLRRDGCNAVVGLPFAAAILENEKKKGKRRKKSAPCNCHSAIVLNDSLDHCSCLVRQNQQQQQ